MRALERGVSSRLARIGRYALCATIDDIILNTSWGKESGWAGNSLVGSIYNETWGGERFYDLLSQARRQPERNRDLLELLAICLAIGFVGKYRVIEDGHVQHIRLRHDLFRTIRHLRGPYEHSLSGPWPVVDAPYRPPQPVAGIWPAATILAVLMIGLWVFSSITLRQDIEAAAAQIRALAPTIPTIVVHPEAPPPPKADPIHRTERISRREQLEKRLGPDIESGRIEIVTRDGKIVLRILNAAFPSGGLRLAELEEPLLARIGKALEEEKGPILVVGHTDNVPVGAGSRLGNNMAISEARARSAADMLRPHLSDPSRIRVEGRGQSDPIATNASAEGRARNRRVEFHIPVEEEK